MNIPKHVYEYVTLLHEQGKTEQEISKQLQERGYSDEVISEIILESFNREAKEVQNLKDSKGAGCFLMMVGFVFLLGGLVVTIYTYEHSFGGRYILAYGPIVFGIAAMVGGAAQAANNNRKIAKH